MCSHGDPCYCRRNSRNDGDLPALSSTTAVEGSVWSPIWPTMARPGKTSSRDRKNYGIYLGLKELLCRFLMWHQVYVTTYIPHDFQKAALDFTRSPDDVPSSEYNTQTRRFQEFVDDMGSIIKGYELKLMKRTNAVFPLQAAKVRRMQDCLNDVEYVSHDDDGDDDDSKDHPISVIMEPVYNVSPNGKFRRRIMSRQKGELLGNGSFGSVYEGLTDDGFFFAVKEASLQDQGAQGKQSILQLEQEISLLSRFEHDNIVQYLGTDKDEK